VDDGSIESSLEYLREAFEGSQLDLEELEELERSSSESEASATDPASEIENDDPRDTRNRTRRVAKSTRAVNHPIRPLQCSSLCSLNGTATGR
jgi:hypothetical protein